ncbi:MAG: ABC transporter permease [Elusimicrobia bacterium]|nr:ABC transporter permease [Elusimicrobiota bacterium]MBU2614738.1 ABC transporter permease [Elusimicrobiota bacterium]
MKILSIVNKELRYNKASFLISVLFVSLAVASVVSIRNMSEASKNKVRILMRDLGNNLAVLPKGTDPEKLWAGEYTLKTLPENYVNKLAGFSKIEAQHFVGKLQKYVVLKGNRLLLTGLMPEINPPGGSAKDLISPAISDGNAILGADAAKILGLKKGQNIDINGSKFLVEEIKQPLGSIDDISIFVSLKSAQKLLGLKGLVSSIEAMNCICYGDYITEIKNKLEKILPDTQIIVYRNLAVARTETRLFMDRLGFWFQLSLFILTVFVLGIYSYNNVKERKIEVATLSALGISAGRISLIFIYKLLFIALAGALAGFLLGTGIAVYLGPKIVKAPVKPEAGLILISLLCSCLVVMAAGILPVLKATRLDPAEILRTE